MPIYEEEKAKIENDARALKKIRDDAQKHSHAFGMAVVYLQLAIVLSSIAALMKKSSSGLQGSCSELSEWFILQTAFSFL